MYNDCDTLCKMLVESNIRFEVDSDTYPDRIIVRTLCFDSKITRDKVSAIFDFSSAGKLLYIS